MTVDNSNLDTQIYAECVNSWKNMHLGLFYSKLPLLMENDNAVELINEFEFPEMNDYYELDKEMLFHDFYSQKLLTDGFNSFGFFIIWNSLGNIFRAFREGLEKEVDFKEHIEKTLDSNYEHSKELVYFLRNIFSHNIDESFTIHSDDIRAKKYKTLNIKFKLNSKTLKLSGPNIEIDINLEFSKINGGSKFTDHIKFDDIFLFADFCARLALDYQHSLINKLLGK